MINDRITTGRVRAFNPERGPESGASLVFALFLMLFLTLISFSLVMLISHEVKSSTKLYLSQQALYAAEAGVERKIAQLKEEIFGNIALTDFFGAQYEVAVNSLGADRSEIESTGYVPSKTNFREKRTLSVIVLVNPSVPEHAMAVSGNSVFDGNTTIYGTIRTNSKVSIGQTCRITESSPGKGDASIYSAYDGADRPAISIGNNFQVAIAGQYIKCRADSALAPDTHERNTGTGTGAADAVSPIRPESNIVDLCTVVENDNSSDTDPLDLPSVDLDAIVAQSVDVTTSNYKALLNGGAVLTTPWKLYGSDDKVVGGVPLSASTINDYDVVFTLTNASQWNPAGISFNFKRGVHFNSNSTVGEGEGSVIVSSGCGQYGIELDSNLGSVSGDEVRLNLLVIDGDWSEKDIAFNSNIDIQGYIYGSADIVTDQNVSVIGVMEVGGDAHIKTNVEIKHSSDIPMDIPWKSGNSGLVEIISWQEK